MATIEAPVLMPVTLSGEEAMQLAILLMATDELLAALDEYYPSSAGEEWLTAATDLWTRATGVGEHDEDDDAYETNPTRVAFWSDGHELAAKMLMRVVEEGLGIPEAFGARTLRLLAERLTQTATRDRACGTVGGKMVVAA